MKLYNYYNINARTLITNNLFFTLALSDFLSIV